MQEDFDQFKDLYIQTSRDSIKLLNDHLLNLEKNHTDKNSIDEIFRHAHSLKGGSAMMKFDFTAYLCHTIEDVFFEIKNGTLALTSELADELFKALDGLANSVKNIETAGAELDLSNISDTLKKLTGVKTEGTGKSSRTGVATATVSTTETVITTATPTEGAPSVELTKTEVKTQIKVVPVNADQLDIILDLMGEILVQRLRLKNLISGYADENLKHLVERMELNFNDLQYKIMKTRMLPIKNAFNYLPRAVRDLARKLNKEAELVVAGETLELDRTIVEKLEEPLIHILRNAVDHGIDKKGVIKITADREGDMALVKIEDNGRGVDWEKIAKKANVSVNDKQGLLKALFSGLSTSDTVSEVSGRGVGLYAVKRMIDEFNGSIDIKSEKGAGTTFILKFPLTLAVVSVMRVSVGDEHYVIPASVVDRSITLGIEHIKTTVDQEVFVLDEIDIPLIRLHKKFDVPYPAKVGQDITVVIVTAGSEKIGLEVDQVHEVTDVIIKPVPALIRQNTTFVGSTILGDGKTVLIINPEGLV